MVVVVVVVVVCVCVWGDGDDGGEGSGVMGRWLCSLVDVWTCGWVCARPGRGGLDDDDDIGWWQ